MWGRSAPSRWVGTRAACGVRYCLPGRPRTGCSHPCRSPLRPRSRSPAARGPFAECRYRLSPPAPPRAQPYSAHRWRVDDSGILAGSDGRMSEERGTPRAQPPTASERELVDGEDASEEEQAPVEPPRVIVPRWVQLVLLPISLLALWALARAAGKVLLIFVVAGLIALILNPLVAFMQQRVRLPRGLAVLTVYLAFFLTLAGVGFLLANPISNQVRTFTNNLPHIVNEAHSQIASFQGYLNKHGVHAKLVGQGKTALQTLQDQLSKSAGKLATFGTGLLTEVAKALVDLVLVFVLSVYMLVYGQSIGKLVRHAMPPGDGAPADDFPRLAQHAVSRYVGGQLLFSVVMGASTGLALYLFGLLGIFPDGQKYALAFGVFYGVMELVPYIGPILGAIPAVVLALFTDPISALWVGLL